MTKEEAAVESAYRITDYIRNYMVQAFMEGVEWRDRNPRKTSVDVRFEQICDADEYEPIIKHFRDY